MMISDTIYAFYSCNTFVTDAELREHIVAVHGLRMQPLELNNDESEG